MLSNEDKMAGQDYLFDLEDIFEQTATEYFAACANQQTANSRFLKQKLALQAREIEDLKASLNSGKLEGVWSE